MKSQDAPPPTDTEGTAASGVINSERNPETS